MDTAGVGPQLGRFWAAVIGGEHRASKQDPVGSVVAPGDGPVEGLGITMCAVPETKTVKNRLHWDVHGDPTALESAGATRLWGPAPLGHARRPRRQRVLRFGD